MLEAKNMYKEKKKWTSKEKLFITDNEAGNVLQKRHR